MLALFFLRLNGGSTEFCFLTARVAEGTFAGRTDHLVGLVVIKGIWQRRRQVEEARRSHPLLLFKAARPTATIGFAKSDIPRNM